MEANETSEIRVELRRLPRETTITLPTPGHK
jgi:hypothetical protein